MPVVEIDNVEIEFPYEMTPEQIKGVIDRHLESGQLRNQVSKEFLRGHKIRKFKEQIISDTPVGRMLNMFSPEARGNLALDVLPVTGEIRSGQRLGDLLNNPPVGKIQDGMYIGPDMKGYGFDIGMEAAGTLPLAGGLLSALDIFRAGKKGLEAGKFGQAGAIGYRVVNKNDLGELVSHTNPLPMDEASRMQRARDMGNTTDMWSGSTHNIEAFDGSLGSPDGDWGKGVYASTSIDDVNANYAGQGPDLTGRISMESERVADELMDYPDELLEEYGFKLKDYEADEAGIAEAIAKKRLVGEAEHGVVYPLKGNTSKYAVIGGQDSTKLTEPDYYDLAKSELDIKDYADETDFDDAIAQRVEELRVDDPESLYNKVYEALRDTDAYEYEQQINDVMEEIQDGLIEGYLDVDDLDDAIRNNIVDAYDESGEMVSAGGISGQTLKNLGFEGVIDNKVNLKFGYGRKFGQQMDGVDSTTQHIVTFPGFEKNLRSPYAKFDPAKKDSANLLDSRLLPVPLAALLSGILGLEQSERSGLSN